MTHLFQKHIALPQQHGSWALWLGPYAVGIGVGGALKSGLIWLTLASLGGFLLLQPLTILTKVLAGRRSRSDLGQALFWLAVYALIAVTGAVGLLLTDNGFVLWLGLAALPVLVWQMRLVARREERGQMGVELVGCGVLALAAPAAYWLDTGGMSATGWWLWALCWLQSAGAIVYIYLRLEHRRMRELPAWPERWRMAGRALLYNGANVIIASVLALVKIAPPLVVVPFAAMLAETIYGGVRRPGLGAKPVTIGLRQIGVTVVFAVLLIVAYRLPG